MKKKVLVVIPVEKHHQKLLEEAYPDGEFYYQMRDEVTDLEDVHVIIGNVIPRSLKNAKNLEWIQLNSAGADQYIKEGILKKETILTNATGAYGLALSEQLLAGTLALMKRINQYQRNQVKHLWKDEGIVHSIYGARTLIIGLGDIGSSYGQKMKALGSTVVGIKRHVQSRPVWLDELYSMDSLDQELAKADIVAMSLPSTPLTTHLIDKRRLSLMRRHAILLNVGRGDAIVTEDLCYALNKGLIFGAFLDVTDPEPLPKENALWDADNILITPHIAGDFHLQETLEKVIDITCKNLKRFQTGAPLENIVDRSTGYALHNKRV
ncbi:MAG TPA: D-2-hydroxyacid dehydrogenase [Ruminococcaceae bacterium]|nr:D-2-hydroxyacid dehydrogenase [Oscillospiraceae bacterium]